MSIFKQAGYAFFAAVFTLLQTSCSFFSSKDKAGKPEYSENRARMEVEAKGRLATARRQLAASQYAEAKATIQKMRKDCYLALDARNEGILLMDSVDLRISQGELARVDSLMRAGVDSVGQAEFEEACRKVQFYERKVQFDKKK